MALTVDQKILKATKFPSEFDTPVDKKKVNMDVMKTWIAAKIENLVGDDDILVETTFNWLDEHQFPKIKEIQISLNGFLGDKSSAAFCKELWTLMISAQDSPMGVPKEMLEAKKAELQAEKVRCSQAHAGSSLTLTPLYRLPQTVDALSRRMRRKT
ncbi:PWI domain-containing protein [Lentithecium fluviatile CBS 122367]|uniref:PWI domain-containing protein n=1 Tax=Lentithecium fluviatile CBS 122367 TaxID=1168545 RepID=A0A6G1IXE4_9PLEO|nr:PWI domain-containing protein [Lentithecium fluviatile CBS 122367]